MSFTVAGWSLADIIQESRQITGRPDPSMFSNQQMADFANRYYQYVLPKELKIFWGYTYYQFFTIANQDQYPVPGVGPDGKSISFQTFNPQVWADGWPMCWYLSPDNFYQDYPQQENKLVVGTGDGTTNSFTYSVAAYPILAGSLYVTDGTQIAQDVPNSPFDGSGTFVDPSTGGVLTGTVNYSTGSVVNQAFTLPPALNTNITATSQTYMPNRPQGILYFQSQPLANSTMSLRDSTNVFVIRPVPDQVYKIKMQGIQIPAPLINLTDVPFRTDLGPLIALGMSLHIFKLFNQMDQYDQYIGEYNRYKDICMQDTYEEYLYQRSVPAF